MNAFHKVVAKAIEASRSPEEISLQETEEKFSSLVLAFKTDRETLDKRKELHLRARDIAEQNIQKELEGLKDEMKSLNQICNNCSSQQTFAKVQHHIEVLEQSVARMSSQAEVHGAVQQELRVSRAIDVMVHHVENLKKVYEKEHAELLDARKTLCAGRRDSRESGGSDVNRSTNLPGLPQFRANRRRASIAVISKNPLQLRSSLSSQKLIESNSSRLVHRNSSYISPPLFLEEENEDIESTDNYRPLIRRRSSSIIEELPSDFIDQLQMTSTSSSLDLEEEEEDEEEEDGEEENEENDEEEEENDRDKTANESQNDGEAESVLMYFERGESVVHESKGHVKARSSVLENSVSFGQKRSRKLSRLLSGIHKVKERVQSASRCVSRARFQDTNCRALALVTVLLAVFVILAIGVWLGWIPVFSLREFFTSR